MHLDRREKSPVEPNPTRNLLKKNCRSGSRDASICKLAGVGAMTSGCVIFFIGSRIRPIR
jgi:hypothetical protein